MRRSFLVLALLGGVVLHASPSAWAQRVVPKLENACPMGFVDTFNGRCSTLGLMTYTVKPAQGKACPSGWMNVGGGYCRKK